MAHIYTEEKNFKNIANAIRLKNGTNNTYTPGEMAKAISEIVPFLQEKEITITKNGVQTIKSDREYDGLSKVKVVTELPLEEKRDIVVTPNMINEEIRPSEDYLAMKKVIIHLPWETEELQFNKNGTYEISLRDKETFINQVNIEVSVGDIKLQDEENIYVSHNGTVSVLPDEGYNAIKKVNVEVDIPLQETKDITLTDNGTITITPDEGYNAIKKVNVTSSILKKGIDFTKLGYTEEETEKLNSGMDYALEIYTNWDNSITDCKKFFENDENLIILPPIITYKVVTTRNMFSDCYKLKIISPIDTSNVTDMHWMFGFCYSLKTIPLLNTSSVTDMSSMFYLCRGLTTIPQLDTSNVIDMFNMFGSCQHLKTIPLLNTSSVTDMLSMFSECTSLTTIPQLDTLSVTDMGSMFTRCTSLISIPLLDTSKVTNMSGMFYYCYSLTTIPFLDTSNVTSMGAMFTSCSALENLGGFLNCKVALNLSDSTKLTHQSLMNVINNLYDLTTNGLNGQTLKLGSTNIAKLTADEIAIATNKGWTIN